MPNIPQRTPPLKGEVQSRGMRHNIPSPNILLFSLGSKRVVSMGPS